MSLEELLVALAVTGILTVLLLDAWRMVSDIRKRALDATEAGVAVYDSLSRGPAFVQERLDEAKLDSLMESQTKKENQYCL